MPYRKTRRSAEQIAMMRAARDAARMDRSAPNYPHCEALVANGLMRRYEGNPLTGGEPMYVVTDEGKAAKVAANAIVTGARDDA